MYQSLEPGIERAIFIMFLIAEVHPFLDGNGRLARIMMNAELMKVNQCNIIIPTVYREDYLLSLKKVSHQHDANSFIRMLLRAQLFTASINFTSYDLALAALQRSQAFLEPHEGKLTF
jgi:Fic family protein